MSSFVWKAHKQLRGLFIEFVRLKGLVLESKHTSRMDPSAQVES